MRLNVSPEIVGLLGAGQVVRRNIVVLLITVDASGFPRVSLLSPYQVVAQDQLDRLYICVNNGSTTSRNLAEGGKATVVLFCPPAAHYIWCTAEEVVSSMETQRVFRLTVAGYRKDALDIAPLTGQVFFDDSRVKDAYTKHFLMLCGALEAQGEGTEKRGAN